MRVARRRSDGPSVLSAVRRGRAYHDAVVKFIDQTTVQVVAGTGGSGCTSFRREAFVPKGGPDGGDGGRGGSIFVTGDAQLSTLLDYRYRALWKADRGQHGMGSNKTGKSAEDIYLPVPPGTIIRDVESRELIGEILASGDVVRVAKGGRGGRGNARFATPSHQAPREWEPGEQGEARRIELELKLIADVGLLGEPNAGKSTLLSVLSAARPKIAEYPFTTLTPQLGVVGLGTGRSFVLADIPGIIEGAHEGRGLGDRFLRHVERTKTLAYLIPLNSGDVQAVYDLLRREARAYSPLLATKPHIVVLTKRDLLPVGESLPTLAAPDAQDVVEVSSVAHLGVDDLKERLWALVRGDTAPSPDVPLP